MNTCYPHNKKLKVTIYKRNITKVDLEVRHTVLTSLADLRTLVEDTQISCCCQEDCSVRVIYLTEDGHNIDNEEEQR